MEGFPIIHLRGQLGSLGNTVIQRLLREKVEIVLSTDDFEEANEKFSVDLEFSQSRIVSSEDCKIHSGHRIFLFGFLRTHLLRHQICFQQSNVLRKILQLPVQPH